VQPLAHVVDLFSTFIELAGDRASALVPDDIEIDSVSLVPYLFDQPHPNPRTWVLIEVTMGPTVADAIRDERRIAL